MYTKFSTLHACPDRFPSIPGFISTTFCTNVTTCTCRIFSYQHLSFAWVDSNNTLLVVNEEYIFESENLCIMIHVHIMWRYYMGKIYVEVFYIVAAPVPRHWLWLLPSCGKVFTTMLTTVGVKKATFCNCSTVKPV